MKVLMATMLSFAVFSNAYAKESSDREYRKRFLQHSALRTCFGMMSRLARGMPELTNIEVTSLISRDYGNEQTLEVGAATRPVCTRCRQVDRYTSAFDMIKQNAKFDPRMRKKSDEELIRINMAFYPGKSRSIISAICSDEASRRNNCRCEEYSFRIELAEADHYEEFPMVSLHWFYEPYRARKSLDGSHIIDKRRHTQ